MGADRERRLDFVPTEEQQLLGDQVRALCEKHAPPQTLRELITDNVPWRRELWDHMGELGLLGAAIPEACGGVGLGPMELAVINRELGRAVAPVPFFSSTCMAAEAIRLAATLRTAGTLAAGPGCGQACGHVRVGRTCHRADGAPARHKHRREQDSRRQIPGAGRRDRETFASCWPTEAEKTAWPWWNSTGPEWSENP